MADLRFASGGAGDLHLVPQTEGDLSPACLDGSPYGFYFVPSTTNSTKWTVSISGARPARDVESSARLQRELDITEGTRPVHTSTERESFDVVGRLELAENTRLESLDVPQAAAGATTRTCATSGARRAWARPRAGRRPWAAAA